MAWLPISFTVPQYMDGNGDPYSGAVLKAYQDGTTTNTNLATDNTGGTQLADVVLDSNGYPSNGGSIFIPHIDQAYKLALYPTEAAADADTGAIWTIDNLSPADLTDTDTDELAKVSSNDTTAGYLNGKLVAGAGVTLTENSDGGNETLSIGTNIATLGTEQASTSGTEIDFTSIPSWVTTIDILMEDVSTSGTSQKMVQIGDSGGVETSGYTAGSLSLDTTPTIGQVTDTSGFVLESGGAGDALSGTISLKLKDSSNNTWVVSGMLWVTGATEFVIVAGHKSLTATLDRVRVTTFGGTDTFDNGSINILYS